MRLDLVRRLKWPASPSGLPLRAAWKYGLGAGIAAVLLTAGGVNRLQPNGHALATNILPTTVPCGTIATDPLDPNTATWRADTSPYGTGSPYNLPVNTTNNTDPAVTPCDAIVVPKNVTLKIDASQGPVQIFSHGAAIKVDGGHLLVLGSSEINSVLFDAEPDVASWTGITINASDSTHAGNASLAFASIQHALNSITITSAATSTPDPTDLTKQLPYGLAVVNSGIGPSYFDGIDAIDTPVHVQGQSDLFTGRADGKFGTINNIGSQGIKFNWDAAAPPLTTPYALDIESVTFGSSVPFAETSCLPLQIPCSAGSIGNDAIFANFKDASNPPPVFITKSRFYRAGSFGVELNFANRPVIKDNNFDCNGVSAKALQACAGSGLHYSAVYLSAATVDLENSVTNNVGHEDGLDAIVLNGTIVYAPGLSSPQLTWRNATNDATNDHPLGYLLNGDLSINSGTLVVQGGGVVKSKGTINLTGAALDASDTTRPGTKVFTSLRDNINIPSCPSVFVQSCPSPLPAGEWGGINLVGSATDANLRSATKSTITNAVILYATTGVHILNGNSLSISGSAIGSTFADGVLAEGTPLAVTGTTFGCPTGVCSGPSSGNHAILADFRNSGPAGAGLKVGGPNAADRNTFQGSVNEAIRGVGLAGQPVDIENNAIRNAGAAGSAGSAGIYLQGADRLTLKSNDIVGSGTGSLRYPAIWLDGVSNADFNSPISGNTGSGNGLNAIAFHGDSRALTWQTLATSGALGFIVDGNLLVAGDLTMKLNDYAPVLAGTVTVQGGALTSTGARFTSLKENRQLSCGSVFVPLASGVCPATSPGDWGGLVLDAGKTNTLTDSFVRYAVTGISMSTPSGTAQTLTLANTSIGNTAGDGLNTRWPVSISGGAFTGNGGRGIKVDLSGFGPSPLQSVSISGTAISGSGQDGILAVGLAGEKVTIDQTSVDRAGAFGINLKEAGKDVTLNPGTINAVTYHGHLTLTNNTVTNSAATFPAIYLNDFFGPIADVSGNTGASNGVNAIAFHGTVTDDLAWKTARRTGDPAMPLGYILDNTLTMQSPHILTVSAGDVVKVGNGGILNMQGATLLASDTSSSGQKVFTSLTDDSVGVATCRSAVVIACAGAVQPSPQAGDWGGIILTAASGNGVFVNAAVRYASTGILINSGATSTTVSSVFGLVVSGSSIGPSAVDGINAVRTPITVTTSSISGGTHGVSVDFSGGVPSTPVRLSGNRFLSTSAEAIVGQALAGQPVWITDNRIQGAGTYGIRLLSADQLVLRNNNVAGSGGGPGAGAGRYPAIYLPALSGDFAANIRGNVGSGNGLDALAFDGQVTSDLTWITPSNASSTHPLGYLLDGGVTVQAKNLTVGAGDVVKSLGGPITINGGSVTATGAATILPLSPSSSAIFTSLKDNPSAPASPVDRSDAAAASCPSVLVSVCTPGPGDWGGLVITSNAAGARGGGDIRYGLINFANTGISLDSGPNRAPSEPNFRLTVANTTIANASKDGLNSLDTPFSVSTSSTIQNVGANGIIASFFSPANCPPSPALPAPDPCVRFNVSGSAVSGTGKDGIVANGLSGQPTVISGNTITDAATYGIRLVGADRLTLTTNHVRKSAFAPGAFRYPAIYLSSVKADFEVASGAGAMIQGNDGKWNGLDAIVFHGEATKRLAWITAARSIGSDVTFGYLLDGPLTVDGDFVTAEGDVVKIMNGGIKINGGGLKSTGAKLGTIFTSLKDNPGMPTCNSVFIPDACPSVAATLATNADWNGISIDGADSVLQYGQLLYATSGVTINSAKLKITSTLITGLQGYAITTTGTGSAQIDCASIHGNGGGVSSNGAATTAVTYSNLFGNTTSTGKDYDASVAATATNDWWGAAAPVAGQYNATNVTVSNPLTQEKPALKTSSTGAYVTSDNTNANGNIGKGKLTLTFNREMNATVQPVVTFVGPDAVTRQVAGTWSADHLSWTSTAAVDSSTSAAGANSMTVSQGASCIPDGNNAMDQENNRPFTLDFTTAVVAGSGGATGISGTAATLNDSVNASGWSRPSANPNTATFAFFQIRLNGGSYDATVANVLAGTVDPTTLPGYTSIGYGTVAKPVSFAATTLAPVTTYDYRVVAFDLNGYSLGADQLFTTLDVAPGAPTAVTGSPGNGKATVSWTPPLANGGTAITKYTVTASPGGAQASTFDGTTTSVDVPGLANGTAYTFTVVATNAAGSSPPSTASTAIAVGAPPAPGSANAVQGSAGQAVLSWTVPANNGSTITSYTVTPYDGTTKGTPIVLLGPAVTGTTLSGLISQHTYTFTVFATNGNGDGPIATTNPVTVS